MKLLCLILSAFCLFAYWLGVASIFGIFAYLGCTLANAENYTMSVLCALGAIATIIGGKMVSNKYLK